MVSAGLCQPPRAMSSSSTAPPIPRPTPPASQFGEAGRSPRLHYFRRFRVGVVSSTRRPFTTPENAWQKREIAMGSNKINGQLLDDLPKARPTRAPRQFLNSALEARNRLRRDTPSRLLSSGEAEAAGGLRTPGLATALLALLTFDRSPQRGEPARNRRRPGDRRSHLNLSRSPSSLTAGALFVLALVAVLGVESVRATAPAVELTWEEPLGRDRFIVHTRVLLGAISLDLVAVLFGDSIALPPVFALTILAAQPRRHQPATSRPCCLVVIDQSSLLCTSGR